MIRIAGNRRKGYRVIAQAAPQTKEDYLTDLQAIRAAGLSRLHMKYVKLYGMKLCRG